MPYEFRLPDIGEGVAEGEVTKWMVKPGDTVQEDQPLVEVMTDKATVEIPSPVAGKILEIRAQVGQVVPVESVLVVIDAEGGKVAKGHGATPAAPAAKPASPAPAPAAPRTITPAPSRPPAPAPVVASAPVRMPAEADTAVLEEAGRVLATPATRRLARELGIDLSTVDATGPHGRVTKEDVVRAGGGGAAPGASRAPAAPATRPAAAPAAGAEERIPIVGVRRKIAEQMRRSLDTAAHFTILDEADVSELVRLRAQAAALAEPTGVRVTYLPFVMKALVAAMREYPHLNATMDEARGELVVRGDYNFGIATDTERGLIVPVVKGVDGKTVFELARDVQGLAEKARAGKVALDDLRDGTFTITSAGSIGTLAATPIIHVPEVAILGVHKIEKRPVVRDGAIVARDMVTLSLSLDHRVVDGALAARFMNAVIRGLESPALLFLGTA